MGLAFVTASELRASSGSSISGTITAPTAGNLLYVFAVQAGGNSPSSVITVTDDHSNAYAQDASADDNNATSSGGAAAFHAKNIASGVTFTPTLTFTTGDISGGLGMFCEVSGADTSAPFVAGEKNTATGSSTSRTTGSLTNSKANAIFFAGFSDTTGSNPESWTEPGSPWLVAKEETNGSAYFGCSVLYQIVSTSALRSATWTGADNVDWCGLISDYVAAAGAATPYVPAKSIYPQMQVV